jgi:uncharacterized protein YkwD
MDPEPEGALRPSRREALAGLAAAGALPACSRAADLRNVQGRTVDMAPPATDAAPWIAYERRLRARLADAAGGRFDAETERAVLAATNNARASTGAAPLAWHEELALAARAHAADLASRGVVAHVDEQGFDPSHRFWLLARRTVGSPSENIAYHRGPDPASAGHLMETWRKSPQHWKNLLRPSHTHAAFGLVRLKDRSYLVGLYQAPVTQFAHALPFRPAAEAEVRRRLEALPGGLSARIEPPEGARSAFGEAQVVQAMVRQDVGQGRYRLIGGPIFLAPADMQPIHLMGET